MTPAEIIQKYIAVRDKIERMNTAHEAAVKPYADALDTLEGMMAQHMLDTGTDSVKADGIGTAFKKSGTRVRVADRESFVDFLRPRDDAFDFFTNAVVKEMILDYVKEHGTPPPGVDYTRYTEVQFRRA